MNGAESLSWINLFLLRVFQVRRPRFFGFGWSAVLPSRAGFPARRDQRPVRDGAAEMRVGGFDIGITVSRLMAPKIFESGVERRPRRRLFPDWVPGTDVQAVSEASESRLAGFPASGAAL